MKILEWRTIQIPLFHVFEALYKANMKLIHMYQKLQMENLERICE